jgi:hypothetical protein
LINIFSAEPVRQGNDHAYYFGRPSPAGTLGAQDNASGETEMEVIAEATDAFNLLTLL